MRPALLLAAAVGALIGLAPVAAQSIRFDPHVDLPASAALPGWTGTSDPTSQFDVDRALAAGVNVVGLALFVPQGDRTPAAQAESRWGLGAGRGFSNAAGGRSDPETR